MTFRSHVDWANPAIQKRIIHMAKSGMSLAKVGDYFGVSRQRIKQVYKQYELFSEGELVGKRLETTLKKREHEGRYDRKWGVGKGYGYEDDLYREQRLKLKNKKHNAKHAGIEWDLEYGDLEWPTHCPILGVELNYFSERISEYSPSFDRIDPSKGYIPGNVHIISMRANRLKNNGSANELRKIADYLDNLNK